MGEYRQWRISTLHLSLLQQQGLAYWHDLRGEASVPPFGAFELMELPAAILPTTHMADAIDGGTDFRYRFWGSGFRDHFGYDATDMTISQLMPEDIREPILETVRFVVSERRPIATMSAFMRGTVAPTMGFQKVLRLPLRDGTAVTRIVSLVEFLQSPEESQKIINAVGTDGTGPLGEP